MVDIQPQTVQDSTYDDGAPWLLASDRSFNRSITLDLSRFGSELRSPDGRFVLSGVALAKAPDGLWGPAGDQKAAGHLLAPVEVVAGSTRASAVLVTQGTVNAAAVPGGAPAKGNRPPLIQYQGARAAAPAGDPDPRPALLATFVTTMPNQPARIGFSVAGAAGVEADWGDGTAAEIFPAADLPDTNHDHVYAEPGTYHAEFRCNEGVTTPRLSPNFQAWPEPEYLNALVSVDRWDDALGIQETWYAFWGQAALVTVPPHLPATVNHTGNMFMQAVSFNGAIGAWDVSRVTNMFSMFEEAESFNQDLSGWDVSAVRERPPGNFNARANPDWVANAAWQPRW